MNDDDTTVGEAHARNAVDSLLAGAPVPVLPGVDDLLTPLLHLGASLGSGSFAGIDPVGVFSRASTLIDQAMDRTRSGLADVEQTWSSAGSGAAHDGAESAQSSGALLSERGNALSRTTAAAADSVQRGNANLATIAQSFAATAVAAAPLAWTPAGQTMLISSAAEHMQAAMAVVGRIRSEMATHTAAMNALDVPVHVPAPPVDDAMVRSLDPHTLAEAAHRSTASGSGYVPAPSAGSELAPAGTSAAQASGTPGTGVRLWAAPSAAPVQGGPASPTPPGSPVGSGIGWAGGIGAGTRGVSAGPAAGGGLKGTPETTAGQSRSGALPASTGAPGGSGPSNGIHSTTPGAMAGTHGTRSDESSRPAPGYLVDVTDNNSMLDGLPMVSPPVLGAHDPNLSGLGDADRW